MSIALTMHDYYPEGAREPRRTSLGQSEYEVKYLSDVQDTRQALNVLVAEMQRRLEELPYYREVDCICAVPSTKPFMRDIINALNGFSFEDISDKISWAEKKGSLKEVASPEEKLELIDTWGLVVACDLKGKNVLLVDDMYKSGVTMQYVGMKLKEAGASRVFGLALCKSLGND